MLKEAIKKTHFLRKPAIYIYNSIPDHIKYGKVFRSTYEFLQESQWWSEDKLKEYQLYRLKDIVQYSYENVPYYTKLFNEYGINPADIKDLNDIKKIPYLTKEIIKNNKEELISKKYKKWELLYSITGGTSGMPMEFYEDKMKAVELEWAHIANLWTRIGYDIKKNQRSIFLRGMAPKKGNYEYRGKDLILSSFNLTKDNIVEYIKMIEEFNAHYIQSYPSLIKLLADYINISNIKLNLVNLKAIICASETLCNEQRISIEKAFGVRVFSFYGHSEHSCLAGECEESNYYHIQSEYGYTELVIENGLYAENEGEACEIVCTGFNNYAFPFIRYKTGDIAINTNRKCKCGRNYKLIKRVEGRIQDYFIDSSGNKILFTYRDIPLWKYKQKVSAYQYVQNERGNVILFIDLKEKLFNYEIDNIKKEFNECYPNFNIIIKMVDNIPRTSSGKYMYLIQNIK